MKKQQTSTLITTSRDLPCEPEGGKRNWEDHETTGLALAWKMSSMSPVLGNDMKVSTFWASIDDKFHQNPNVKARIPLRKLKSHWQILNRTCTKFAGCHFRILRQNASGLDKDGKASEFAC